MKPAKIAALARANPVGLRFSELCRLAEAFGFRFDHQRGSHRFYTHDEIKERLNFQPLHGMAKGYQVRQLLDCVDRHHLSLEDQ
jgi:predicted RNA binding protein YcfA (HicA-like mRNA interferase family)